MTTRQVLTRNEAAEELQIDYVTLGQLIGRRIFRPSIARPPGAPDATSYRGNLLFSRSDLEAARSALRGLCWLATVTPDSWRRLSSDGLTYTLLSARYARQADTLRDGNRIAFYVTGRSAFTAIANVTGRRVRKNTMWPQGVYPYRIPLSPDVVLSPEAEVPAKALLSDLAFINNRAHWEMYFRGTIRLIDAEDFDVISRAVRTAGAASAPNS